MVTSIILAFEYIGMSTAVATFAANFALSYVVTRVFGSNTSNQQIDNGVRLQVPPSTVNAIPVVYGDAYLGGTFVDAALTENQRKMYYVLAISSISPNGTFTFDRTDMYYGDRLITFESGSGADLGKVVTLTDEAGNADPKISGNLYIYLFTSNDAGVITPINSAGTLPSGIMGSASGLATSQQWPATGRQMNGTAFAIVVLNYNRDADTTSLQPITFKVSHNLNGLDRARPGDVWFDYMNSPVYGGAIDAAYLDTTTQATLNAYSDALITYTNSGGSPATQRRYKINGVLDAGEAVINNVDRIMSACDSWMTYNAASGKWAVVVNKSETTAYAFNDNNIIGEIRVSATDISSSINQVEARFPFKESRDQAAFVNLETPTALLYPNEPVNKYSVTYDLVNDSVQATYLANRVLEQSREDLIVNFNTTYYGIQVEAGDVVSVTNNDYGWCAPAYPDGKPFRVMKVNEAAIGDGTLGARLELSEYNAEVYDDKDITQFAPVANSGLVSPIYFSPLTAPVVVASYPSASVPSFDLQITTPVTGRAVFANIYYSTTPTPTTTDLVLLYYTQTSDNKPAPANTAIVFPNFVLPAGTYYFVFNVGNNDSLSALSGVSSAFVWNPVGMTGPTGPTGPTGSGTSGTNGLTAITAYRVQSQSASTPTFTTPTSGATAPSGWSLSAPSVAVGQVLWYIQGQYNSNAVTVSGVAANTTAWTGPIAASVFQDIRSDNWNGSNPPVYGTTGTYGTAGYYIQQSTGDVFFNNGIFRANINTSGDAVFKGDNTTTTNIPIYDSLYYIDYSVFGDGTTTASLGNVRAGVLGTGNSNGSIVNAGVIGYASNPSFVVGGLGIGVIGSGYNIGGYFSTYISSGVALVCTAASSAYTAFQINQGKFAWGAYSIAQPTGSTSTFLRNDGTWATPASSGGVTSLATSNSSSGLTLSASSSTGAVTLTLSGTPSLASLASDSNALGGYAPSSWARIFPTNSGTANAGGSGLNLLGSGSTGIAGAYVGTSGSGNTVSFAVQTTSPSDVRLKEEITDTDLGLAFVKQLRPVSYKLKADPKHQKGYGFIADEVEQVIGLDSSLVYFEENWQVGEEKGFKTIHYPSYIAVLTKAIQELSAQVEELKKQIPKV